MIKVTRKPQLPLGKTEVHDHRNMRDPRRASARTLGPLTETVVAGLSKQAPDFVIVSDDMTVAFSSKERAEAPRSYRSSAVEDRWLHIAYRRGSRGKARSVLLIWDEYVVMWRSQALTGLALILGDLDQWHDPDKAAIAQVAELALLVAVGQAAGMDDALSAAYAELTRLRKLRLTARDFRKAVEPLTAERRAVAYLLAPGWEGTSARFRSTVQKLTPDNVAELRALGAEVHAYSAIRAAGIGHSEAVEAARFAHPGAYCLAREASLNHTESLALIAAGSVESYCTALKAGADRREAQQVADNLSASSVQLYARARRWVGHSDALNLAAAPGAELYCAARAAGVSDAQAREATALLGQLHEKIQQAYRHRLRALPHAMALHRSVPCGLLGGLQTQAVRELASALLATWGGTWADLEETATRLAEKRPTSEVTGTRFPRSTPRR